MKRIVLIVSILFVIQHGYALEKRDSTESKTSISVNLFNTNNFGILSTWQIGGLNNNIASGIMINHQSYRFGLEFISKSFANEHFRNVGEVADTLVTGSYQSAQLYIGYEWPLFKELTYNWPVKLHLFGEAAVYHGQTSIRDDNSIYQIVNRSGNVNHLGLKLSCNLSKNIFIGIESAVGTYLIAQSFVDSGNISSTIGFGYLLQPIRSLSLGFRI